MANRDDASNPTCRRRRALSLRQALDRVAWCRGGLLILWGVALPAMCALAGNDPPGQAGVTDPVASRALRAYQAGEVDAAMGILDTLFAADADDFTALIIRGHITLSNDRRDDAKADFTRAAEIAPDRPEGHHGLGLVEYDRVRKTQRAVLTLQKLVLRNPEKKAIQHFERALELEPEFHDAALALGELLLNRGRAEDHERVVELLRDRLGADYRLADMFYGMARALVGLDRFGEAENLLVQLLGRLPEHNGGLLRLVELEMETGRPDQASATYRRLLDALVDPAIIGELRLDLEPVLSTGQLGDFDVQPGPFLRRYWNRYDPTPTTPVNEHLIEHLERLHYVRFHYGSRRPSGFDDRGAVYLRFGAPDDRYISPGTGSTQANESWAYNRIADRITTFDFVDQGGGEFVLTHDLTQAVNSFSTRQDDQLTAMVEVFQERQHLSPAYARTANELRRLKDGSSVSATRMMSDLRMAVADYRRVSEELQIRSPQAVYPEPPGMDELEANLAVARFRGNGEMGRLEVYYGLGTPQLSFTRAADGASRAVLEESFVLFDTHFEEIARARRQRALTVDDPDDAEQSYVGQLAIPPPGSAASAYLPAGPYQLAFALRDVSSNQRRVFWVSLEMPDYPADSLRVSDLQFARELDPARPPPGLKPYPYAVIDGQHPIFVHYEVYGLGSAPDGLTDFRIAYEVQQPDGGLRSLLGRLNPFDRGGSSRIEINAERRGQLADEIDVVELDFGDLGEGNYELTVRVEDRVRGAVAESSANLRVIKAE